MHECDPNKLPTLDFVSGDRTFRVPPFAYFGQALVRYSKIKKYLILFLKKKSKLFFKRSGKCAHLVGNSRDDKWHLGMPFLRTHCVALDLATNRVWLGEGCIMKFSIKKRFEIFICFQRRFGMAPLPSLHQHARHSSQSQWCF